MVKCDNLCIDGNNLIIKINSKLYPIEAVYSAAYVFMDRAYIVLDGDPEKEILVNLKLKLEGSLEELGNEFNNELINYSDYIVRAKETKKIREMILQRAIITNDPSFLSEDSSSNIELPDLEEESFLDDPDQIAVPWEEKYNENKEKKSLVENENNIEQ